MTDLEQYVEQPGRDELIKQVRSKINELGITYIYYQFISVTGRIVGKGIPADHWERTAMKGFQLVYGSTANLFIDRHGDYIGYGPERSLRSNIAYILHQADMMATHIEYDMWKRGDYMSKPKKEKVEQSNAANKAFKELFGE